MSWVFTLLIAVVAAGVGLLAAGYVANLSVDWHNISSFEGKSGFFVVGMALVGAVAAFAIGIVVSRVVGAESLASNARGLAAAVGVVLLLAGVAAGYSYATADFPPQIGGKQLDLEIELRLPPGVEPAALANGERPAEVSLYSGQAYAGKADLRLGEAAEVGGRWVAPARTFIGSSVGGRRLIVYAGDGAGYYIPIPLAGRPSQADTAWSGWFPVEYLGDLSKPAADQRWEARYRVVVRAE